ncbi:MAG: S8 family serine peptidase [Minicystis sp.]
MPCSQHPKGDEACPDCLVDDLLTFDPSAKTAGITAKLLGARLSKLKLTQTQEDICLPILASLNHQLGELDIHVGQAIQPYMIRAVHRDLYRQRMRTDGVWIGFYELEVLAQLFNIQFNVAIPAGNQCWRLYPIGSQLQNPISPQNTVLRWTGSHYEVGRLNRQQGALWVVDLWRETNPLGNCGLEAFLALLFSELGLYTEVWKLRDAHGIGPLIRGFFTLVKTAGKGTAKVDATGNEYKEILAALRNLVMDTMSDEEVNDAILAEGVLPRPRDLSDLSDVPDWHEIMSVDEARRLVLEQKLLTPVGVAVTDGGFLDTHKQLEGLVEVKGTNNGSLEKKDHGTNCAGLIVGRERGNFLGGVARPDPSSKLNVTLLLRAYGSGNTKDDVQLWRSPIDNGHIRVVSMSYGEAGSTLADLGDFLSGFPNTCTFVIAPGNSGRDLNNRLFNLGCHSILVTATTVEKGEDGRIRERLIRDCSYGNGVLVCAPGSGSVGTNDGLLEVISTSSDGKHAPFSNTSCATPMVAGVIALMLAVNPALTRNEVREILCVTAVPIDLEGGSWGSPPFQQLPKVLQGRPYSKKYGFGRVDARAAVEEVIRRLSSTSTIVISPVQHEGKQPKLTKDKHKK